jgi:hypothetical protein
MNFDKSADSKILGGRLLVLPSSLPSESWETGRGDEEEDGEAISCRCVDGIKQDGRLEGRM